MVYRFGAGESDRSVEPDFEMVRRAREIDPPGRKPFRAEHMFHAQCRVAPQNFCDEAAMMGIDVLHDSDW